MLRLIAGLLPFLVLEVPTALASEPRVSLSAYAVTPGPLINGVAVSRTGRVFASLPRWGRGPTPGLAEVSPEGSFKPFPGEGWNEWRPGLSSASRFVSVHSAYADGDGNLWVVDEGPPLVAATVAEAPGLRPKLVQIDLRTNRVVRVYQVGTEVAPQGSNLGHVRVDPRFIYISEPGLGAVIVIERVSGAMHRRLADVSQSKADPSIKPVVHGNALSSHGVVPQINLDLLELDPTGRWLYFMPLFGPHLYRIAVGDLTNYTLDDRALAGRIQSRATVPPASGLTKSRDGTFYMCSLTDMAIVRLEHDGAVKIVLSDRRFYLPNEPSFGPDGRLYVPVSRPDFVTPLDPDLPATIYRTGPLDNR